MKYRQVSETRPARNGSRRLFYSGLLLSALSGACLLDSGLDPVTGLPSDGNRTAFNYSSVSVGGQRSCLLTSGGGVRCWGPGRLGDGLATGSFDPVRVAGGIPFLEVRISSVQMCGISTNDLAFCWGSNSRGGLGVGTTEPSDAPIPVATDIRFSMIDTRGQSACGVALDGFAHCWGDNRAGELGIASGDTTVLVPAAVAGGHRFADLARALDNTCAITLDGELYCWGSRWAPEPQLVTTEASFVAVDGESHTFCGLTAEGEVWCWGENEYGMFANGEVDEGGQAVYHLTPTRATTELRFSAIAVGGRHVCGIAVEREDAFCWGSDDTGQLGDGPPRSGDDGIATTPARVRLSRSFVSIGAGLAHACGVTTEAKAYCWGHLPGDAPGTQADAPAEVG
ncbi:MAG: hypothetical protein R3195_18310 [Gemmatimonadota bacterium]|nr:hypothetical protein [Gemmatimonadota bacterium]